VDSDRLGGFGLAQARWRAVNAKRLLRNPDDRGDPPERRPPVSLQTVDDLAVDPVHLGSLVSRLGGGFTVDLGEDGVGVPAS